MPSGKFIKVGGQTLPAAHVSKRANPKNLKKTTKKGAYKKGAVKQMAKRRNPMVEQKTRVLSEIWQMNGYDADPGSGLIDPINNGAGWPLINGFAGSPIYSSGVFSLLPLHNYTTMFQAGRLNTEQSNRMQGNNIFAKYLNVKGKVIWPVGDDISRLPQSLQLIWGYTCPANFTSSTVPAVGGLMPQNLTAHIVEQLGEYFNSKVDEFSFIPKRNNNLRILGKRWLKPRQGDQYTAVPNAHTTTTGTDKISGTLPDTKFNVSFKIFKKTHYDAGGNLSYAGTADQDQCYNLNDHPIPFVVAYQPNENVLSPMDPDKRPNIAYNSILYYTDS
tara:strand:- start:339 stop:1331 length:993 start_codon:yes stop_codon:yes gene_type:complete